MRITTALILSLIYFLLSHSIAAQEKKAPSADQNPGWRVQGLDDMTWSEANYVYRTENLTLAQVRLKNTRLTTGPGRPRYQLEDQIRLMNVTTGSVQSTSKRTTVAVARAQLDPLDVRCEGEFVRHRNQSASARSFDKKLLLAFGTSQIVVEPKDLVFTRGTIYRAVTLMRFAKGSTAEFGFLNTASRRFHEGHQLISEGPQILDFNGEERQVVAYRWLRNGEPERRFYVTPGRQLLRCELGSGQYMDLKSHTDRTVGSPPKLEDRKTIESTISALYDVISGPKGVKRDWDRFRSLFHADGRLAPIAPGRGPRYFTPDEYAKLSQPIFNRRGFFEKEIHHRIEHFGDLAHVWSTYEGRFLATDGPPAVRGINSIQLVHDKSGWCITQISWQAEDAKNPLPKKYLPKP